jgi:hypothetical protein
MAHRTPDEGYYIFLPELADLSKDHIEEILNEKAYNKLKISPKDFNRDFEAIFHEEVYPNNMISKNDDFMEIDSSKENLNSEKTAKFIDKTTLKINTGLELKRQLIGFITTGGYSMLKGYGIGIGSIDQLYNERVKKMGYVLIRNPSSNLYFKAKIERFYE